MDAFWWILGGGVLMSAIALVGSVTLLLPERLFERIILPLVALSAGSLLAGALFHLMPAAVHEMPGLTPWIWCMVGFGSFFMLEQFLHWHHCHKPTHDHKAPLGWLILIADGVHNFIGGLAVAGAFLIDIRLGIIAWLPAAAHEIPQELGDFGILIHGGFDKKLALLFNLLSGLTFLLGGLVAWGVSTQIDVSFLIPLGAGNFIYIAAADLIPEINREGDARRAVVHFLSFVAGVIMLWAIAMFIPHSHGSSGELHDHGAQAHESHDHGSHEHEPEPAHEHEHEHDHGSHDHVGHDH
jgi:zinc and cadmium transporter